MNGDGASIVAGPGLHGDRVTGGRSRSPRDGSIRAALELIVILLAGAAGLYGVFTLGPLQETLRVSMRLTDAQIAFLQGPAFYFPTLLGSIPVGYLIDRVSRHRLLRWLIALEIVSIAATALAPDFYALCAARGCVSLVNIAVAMNVCALIADRVASDYRGRAFVVFGVAQVLASSLAFAFGGSLLAGFAQGESAWRYAMLAMCVSLLPVLGLTLLVRGQSGYWPLREADKHPPADGEATAGSFDKGSRWKELWRIRAVIIPLSFGPVVTGMGYSAALIWAPPLFTRGFALDPAAVGRLMGLILLISGIVGPIIGGPLSDWAQRRGGPKRIVGLIILLVMFQIPTGFFGASVNLASASIMLTLLAALSYMLGTVTASLTTIAVPNRVLGTAFGVQNAVTAIFSGLAPVLVTALASFMGTILPHAEHEHLGMALGIVCALTSVAGIATFVWSRARFASAEPPSPNSEIQLAGNAS